MSRLDSTLGADKQMFGSKKQAARQTSGQSEVSISNGARLGLAGFIGPLLFGRCIRLKARPSIISWRNTSLRDGAKT